MPAILSLWKGKGRTLAFFLGRGRTMRGCTGLWIFLPLFLFISGGFLGGEERDITVFPPIARLDPRDTAFRQYLGDVETARSRLFTGGEIVPEEFVQSLTVFTYTPREGDDFLFIAARCNLPQAALASLNRLSNPADFVTGRPLLLPSQPGIFVPENPRTELEKLLSTARQGERGVTLVIGADGRKERFFFIPGADFTSAERTFFLNRSFQFPLRNYRLTSTFGPRINPVTGKQGLHKGVDLAAPHGTEVYAVRDGEVSEAGEDRIYGKYVIIRHADNWVSLYGHLSRVEVERGQKVKAGSLIGRVGSTGQATGPHLHFELRQNGRAQDPGMHLRLFQK
jgi:murein DD-endopeptidase MepM/ murein hydrolase activator NlpD